MLIKGWNRSVSATVKLGLEEPTVYQCSQLGPYTTFWPCWILIRSVFDAQSPYCTKNPHLAASNNSGNYSFTN